MVETGGVRRRRSSSRGFVAIDIILFSGICWRERALGVSKAGGDSDAENR